MACAAAGHDAYAAWAKRQLGYDGLPAAVRRDGLELRDLGDRGGSWPRSPGSLAFYATTRAVYLGDKQLATIEGGHIRGAEAIAPALTSAMDEALHGVFKGMIVKVAVYPDRRLGEAEINEFLAALAPAGVTFVDVVGLARNGNSTYLSRFAISLPDSEPSMAPAAQARKERLDEELAGRGLLKVFANRASAKAPEAPDAGR